MWGEMTEPREPRNGSQATAGPFTHRITVRYGECDMQGVVFNPNYLVYADDVCDRWLIAALGRDWSSRFDCAVKKASVEWHSAARHGDTITFGLTVARWGSSSFDVRIESEVEGRQIVTIDLVYVSVAPGSHTPVPVPAEIRTLLSEVGLGAR